MKKDALCQEAMTYQQIVTFAVYGVEVTSM